ncbi:MAG TPA: CHASE2 domain-containing protein [Candidatus Ozemobacteraceae bacterium]|nr:CHASE2 domain-containing protein [Candidatus Ozemobacteraceae bacterium]
MELGVDLLIRLRNLWNDGWFDLGFWLGRHFRKTFYLAVALIFTLLAIAEVSTFQVTQEVRQQAFDAILHYRVIKPRPDPDIVIVDINEASLAAMAREYGRWPWPRQVMGEFIELIQKQKPKAIVFDILFSDPDLYNSDSDTYFNDAIARTDNTFFPMLRLDPNNDALSKIHASMIPGVLPPRTATTADPTIAMVLPHFRAAIDSKRLGFHNIYADDDAVVRRYPVYRDELGWRLPSLPARLGGEFGWSVPDAPWVLLNWRGAPFSYQYVSFAEVFHDLTRKQKHRPANEFTGKILIIGSTAPSLFDIKPTPMSQMHPGVEILATAIDNLKNGDALRYPQLETWYLLLAIAIVWVTAWGFYSGIEPVILDWWFGLSQFFMVGVSYASINLSTVYINLTAPISFALAYFSVTRTYASLTRKALDPSMVRRSMRESGQRQATLLLIRCDTEAISDVGFANIRAGMLAVTHEPMSIEIIKEDQRGFWDLFEKTFAVCWMAPIEDQHARDRINEDVESVIAAFQVLLRRELVQTEGVASWFFHHGTVTCGESAEDSWRALFAETLIQWHKSLATQVTS